MSHRGVSECACVCIMWIYFRAPDIADVFILHKVHTLNAHVAFLVGEKMTSFTQQTSILNSLLMSFLSFSLRRR